jgi:hypothetical protein
MAVHRGGGKDRPPEVEGLDDPAGRQVEDLADRLRQPRIGQLARSHRVHEERHGLGDPDRVGDLQLAAVGEPGGHDVLGHVPHHVGGRAVDLARVLAAEGAAAVPRHAAVGVHDDLAAREAAVAVGPSDDETSRRVDQVGDVSGKQPGRQGLLDDLLDEALLELVVGHVLGVLVGEDDRRDPRRFPAAVLDGDLALAVGPEERQLALLADVGGRAHDLVRVQDRRGHQLGGVPAGVAEHHPLVAGAAGVHTLGDVRGLIMDGAEHRAGLVVDPVRGVVVADRLEHPPGRPLDVDVRPRRDLAAHEHHPRRHEAFARHARGRVAADRLVENRVRDLVADLVGMPLAHALRCEYEVSACVQDALLSVLSLGRAPQRPPCSVKS